MKTSRGTPLYTHRRTPVCVCLRLWRCVSGRGVTKSEMTEIKWIWGVTYGLVFLFFSNTKVPVVLAFVQGPFSVCTRICEAIGIRQPASQPASQPANHIASQPAKQPASQCIFPEALRKVTTQLSSPVCLCFPSIFGDRRRSLLTAHLLISFWAWCYKSS